MGDKGIAGSNVYLYMLFIYFSFWDWHTSPTDPKVLYIIIYIYIICTLPKTKSSFASGPFAPRGKRCEV